jgi:uncharacterized membrane protein
VPVINNIRLVRVHSWLFLRRIKMDVLVVVLRLIHIFGAVFWAGGSFFMVSFIEPSVNATGAEGRKFMQHLGMKTRLSPAFGGAAVFTVLSGLVLYYRLYNNDFGGAMSSGYGISLSVGALFGFIAMFTGFYFQARSTARMKILSAEMAAASGPPTPDQLAEMGALAKNLSLGGRITATLLTLALIGMSIAEAV